MTHSPDLAAIESAALAAWPALEALEFAGWRLRFADGYTKRANSANTAPAARALAPAEFAHIERWYRDRGVPPIFRLASEWVPAGTDEALAARGYRLVEPSLVMVRPLATRTAPAATTAFSTLPSDRCAVVAAPDAGSWLAHFQAVSGKTGPDQSVHLAMLRAIRGRCRFAILSCEQAVASCGLGVCTDGLLGLFDIATFPSRRGRGLAWQVCEDLLAWGQAEGATSAYLQVLATNEGAIRLYRRMGFEPAYRYWYRVGQ